VLLSAKTLSNITRLWAEFLTVKLDAGLYLYTGHWAPGSVMKHWTIMSCVDSQAVPSCHVAPLGLLGLDATQLDADDQQVSIVWCGVVCHVIVIV